MSGGGGGNPSLSSVFEDTSNAETLSESDAPGEPIISSLGSISFLREHALGEEASFSAKTRSFSDGPGDTTSLLVGVYSAEETLV